MLTYVCLYIINIILLSKQLCLTDSCVPIHVILGISRWISLLLLTLKTNLSFIFSLYNCLRYSSAYTMICRLFWQCFWLLPCISFLNNWNWRETYCARRRGCWDHKKVLALFNLIYICNFICEFFIIYAYLCFTCYLYVLFIYYWTTVNDDSINRLKHMTLSN